MELAKKLKEPFPPESVKWKPQSVKANRCLAIAYIDARLVEDRLDDVVGIGGWRDGYSVFPDGSVECTLSIKIDGEWVSKSDVGSPSEQPDGGDRLKAAFSDALKRAAVKWGVGRYVYRLPSVWVEFDPIKKRIVETPKIPAWAMPTKITQGIDMGEFEALLIEIESVKNAEEKEEVQAKLSSLKSAMSNDQIKQAAAAFRKLA